MGNTASSCVRCGECCRTERYCWLRNAVRDKESFDPPCQYLERSSDGLASCQIMRVLLAGTGELVNGKDLRIYPDYFRRRIARIASKPCTFPYERRREVSDGDS